MTDSTAVATKRQRWCSHSLLTSHTKIFIFTFSNLPSVPSDTGSADHLRPFMLCSLLLSVLDCKFSLSLPLSDFLSCFSVFFSTLASVHFLTRGQVLPGLPALLTGIPTGSPPDTPAVEHLDQQRVLIISTYLKFLRSGLFTHCSPDCCSSTCSITFRLTTVSSSLCIWVFTLAFPVL